MRGVAPVCVRGVELEDGNVDEVVLKHKRVIVCLGKHGRELIHPKDGDNDGGA